MSEWTSCGYSFELSPSKFGELRSSNEILGNRYKLQKRMQEDGYLLLRQILDLDLVENCRLELAEKLDSIGDIDQNQEAEILTIDKNGDIYAFNKNLTIVNDFPTS